MERIGVWLQKIGIMSSLMKVFRFCFGWYYRTAPVEDDILEGRRRMGLRTQMMFAAVSLRANPYADWIHHANRLRELVETEDPRYFLNWDMIQNSMFTDVALSTLSELKYLSSAVHSTRSRAET